MSAKEMARLMRARGVRPRPRKRKERQPLEPAERPSRRLVDAFQQVPPGEEKKAQSVYRVPDSWEAPASVKKSLPAADPTAKKKPGRKKTPDHKRRGSAISMCVSPEEEFYLRKFASDQGMGFSEWARTVLFKAMKMEIPPRS